MVKEMLLRGGVVFVVAGEHVWLTNGNVLSGPVSTPEQSRV